MSTTPSPIRLTALMSLAALNGCAVMQPYVTQDTLKNADTAYEGVTRDTLKHADAVYTAQQPICPDPRSVAASVERARRLQGLYENAALDHNRFAVGTGLALIPLSAVVGYKAYVNKNPHNVAALAAGGFVAATGATYLYAPRQKIYFNGIQALDCAIDVVEPLASASQKQRAEVGGQQTTIRDAWRDFDWQRNAVAGSIRSATCDRDSAPAAAIAGRLGELQTRQLDAAHRVNEIQEELHRRSFVPDADVLACNLDRAVQRIRTEVNLQLSTSTPSPAALAAQLSNLALPAAGGVKATKVDGSSDMNLKSTAQDTVRKFETADCPSENAINQSLDTLEEALQTLEDTLGTVQVYLDRTTPVVYDPELLAACSLGATHPPVTISTAPDESLTMKAGESLQVTIVGGYRPYVAVVRNPPADATQLDVKLADDGRTMIVKAGSKSAGTYTLVVSDKSGAAASAKLVVES